MTWPAEAGLAGHIRELSRDCELPTMRLVQQLRVSARLEDVTAAAREEVARVLRETDGAGGEIAVGVGSRGIPDLAALVEVVVAGLREAGFAPFVVPAMGSHGGGTVEGQLEVLESYGVSERRLGVPVRATMETEVVGHVDGLPIHVDRNVVDAGRAFLVNRIKPHTDFRGRLESGISKMAVVGLGKRLGAASIHALGPAGLRDVMPRAARLVADRFLVGGLAVVENEVGEVATVAGLLPAEIGAEPEERLLESARNLMPRLPFAALDVLIVDRIGKDVSGTCVDTNVVGRLFVDGVEENRDPAPRIVVARRLTPGSHGNALGIGLVDFVTHDLSAQVDLTATYVNGLAAGWAGLRRMRLPISLPTDRDAVLAALTSCGRRPDEPPRVLWITDTLHVRTTAASRALWRDAEADDALALVGEEFPLPIDAAGGMPMLADLATTVARPA